MITKLNYKDRSIKSYAIRKLTPRECFKLMGVREKNIDTMQKDNLISASQQYKQAGNSIVVDVLTAIMEQLYYPKPNNKPRQMSIFEVLDPSLALPPMPHKDTDKVKHILTTFSGYDSQLMAAQLLEEKHPDFKWDCVGWSDIDKYVCQMHDIVFPEYADKALGDITKIDWHKVKESLNGEEVSLLTYSSPCQDISQAGKQEGLAEGSDTRSALLWKVADAIATLKPKYLLQENVAALVSEKFMPDFQKWLLRLESMGYVNKWALLNAKDYGVPQNRLRVFCLSMRKDVAFDYQFPDPVPLECKLEDVLDDDVEERYFLKDDAVGKFLKVNDTDNAVFIQYDMPPFHEDAMYLKKWLTKELKYSNSWDKTPTQLEAHVEALKSEFYKDYKKWKGSTT